MRINTPYVPTVTQLKEAAAFTNFDSGLHVVFDPHASEELGKKYYKVTQSFRYYLDETNPDVWAYVPAGYLSDGASVPKPFWWLLPPWGRYGQAAVLHDILCEGKTLFKDEIPYEISRKEADHIFLDAMRHTDVPWYTRYPMFLAVRAWGILGWGANETRLAKKRAIEAEYMKAYGTYREPTAILRQVQTALLGTRKAAQAQAA